MNLMKKCVWLEFYCFAEQSKTTNLKVLNIDVYCRMKGKSKNLKLELNLAMFVNNFFLHNNE